MSDIVGAIKNKPRDYEIRADRSWMTMERSEFLELIAEAEKLTKERDEASQMIVDDAKLGIAEKAMKLDDENAEWVAKSHAWLTASIDQDVEITALKAENAELKAPPTRKTLIDALDRSKANVTAIKASLAELKEDYKEKDELGLKNYTDAANGRKEIFKLKTQLAESEKKVEELWELIPHKIKIGRGDLKL